LHFVEYENYATATQQQQQQQQVSGVVLACGDCWDLLSGAEASHHAVAAQEALFSPPRSQCFQFRHNSLSKQLNEARPSFHAAKHAPRFLFLGVEDSC
jgi:hypothetical protein